MFAPTHSPLPRQEVGARTGCVLQVNVINKIFLKEKELPTPREFNSIVLGTRDGLPSVRVKKEDFKTTRKIFGAFQIGRTFQLE